MGLLNKDIIKQCDRARQGKDSEEIKKAFAALADSQKECPHNTSEHRIGFLDIAVPDIAALPGDKIMYCRACNAFLKYYYVPIVDTYDKTPDPTKEY